MGKFEWSVPADETFNALKIVMTTTPTLALPDFSSPFTIQTDASGDGIGVFLMQHGKPITYMGRSLGVVKQSW